MPHQCFGCIFCDRILNRYLIKSCKLIWYLLAFCWVVFQIIFSFRLLFKRKTHKNVRLIFYLLSFSVKVSALVRKIFYYCVKSIKIRSFFWSLFSRIRTRKSCLFGHFSRGVHLILIGILFENICSLYLWRLGWKVNHFWRKYTMLPFWV